MPNAYSIFMLKDLHKTMISVHAQNKKLIQLLSYDGGLAVHLDSMNISGRENGKTTRPSAFLFVLLSTL